MSDGDRRVLGGCVGAGLGVGDRAASLGYLRHWITDSTVNVKFDDRGRRVYDVEADSFTSYQRALLPLSLVSNGEFEILSHSKANDELDEYYRKMARTGSLDDGLTRTLCEIPADTSHLEVNKKKSFKKLDKFDQLMQSNYDKGFR